VAIGRQTLPPSCYPQEDPQMPHYLAGCVQKSSENFVVLFSYAHDTNWIALGITVSEMCELHKEGLILQSFYRF